MAGVVPRILAMDLHNKKLGYHEKFVVDKGPARLRVYVTRSSSPHWHGTNDRIGWVDTNPVRYIADMIAEKAVNLIRYKESASLDDIRLLLVADRIMNSGKIKFDGEVQPALDPCGFKAVYFLSYPEEITPFESSPE